MLLTIWKNKHVFDLSITMEKVYEKKDCDIWRYYDCYGSVTLFSKSETRRVVTVDGICGKER